MGCTSVLDTSPTIDHIVLVFKDTVQHVYLKGYSVQCPGFMAILHTVDINLYVLL